MEFKTKYTNTDEYICNFPLETQKILKEVRKLIKNLLPKESVEVISYGIPTFKLNGKYVIYFAGYAHHISLYPIPHGNKEFQKKIELFIKGKGTLQFPLDKPIPYDLIKEIVKHSLAANIERSKDYRK